MSSSSGNSSRINELIKDTPLGTLWIIIINVFIYIVIQTLLNVNISDYTLCPKLIIERHQYYRIVSSSLMHGGIIHIAMNMMSTYGLSTIIEKRLLGTVRHILMVLYVILYTSFIYIFVSVVAKYIFRSNSLYESHSIGFSGVLFHMLVLECNLRNNNNSNTDSTRSVFGMIKVSTKIYPFVLLIVLQIFMPNLSFLGHLSGIMTGYAQCYGLLHYNLYNCCHIFSDSVIEHRMESLLTQYNSLISISYINQYQQHQQYYQHFDRSSSGSTTSSSSIGTGIKYIFWTIPKQFLEAIHVVIFGRGTETNDNIQLFNATTARSNTSSPGTTSGGTGAHLSRLLLQSNDIIKDDSDDDDIEWTNCNLSSPAESAIV